VAHRDRFDHGHADLGFESRAIEAMAAPVRQVARVERRDHRDAAALHFERERARA
jgi:hypothetical protein